MDLSDVMDELAAQLNAIDGLRVYAYPPDAIQSPAGIVGWPADGEYDAGYRRGMDKMTIPVIIAVAKPNDRSTKELLAKYCDGSGPYSVKSTLEAETAEYTAFDKTSMRVMFPQFDVVTFAGVDYMCAVFGVTLGGSGTND